jgi:RNA polymerase sigma-70 factor (ECF subfamily)
MNDWPETNESLLRSVKNVRDEHAWQTLVALYRPVVYRIARRGGLNHESAEDVVQNVFLSVSRSIHNWVSEPAGPRFRNWLGRVTRNATINAVTRAKPDRATGTSSIWNQLLAIVNDDDLTDSIHRDVRLQAIRHAASLIQHEFSNRTWAIFCATTMDGQSAAAVAKEFDCSVGTVYVLRCRVTARLREKTGELSDFWSND